jgi:hypothetical protein
LVVNDGEVWVVVKECFRLCHVCCIFRLLCLSLLVLSMP